MKKLTAIFGVLTLLCAVADLIHGQHNGDVHRMWIHIPEFIFFFCFLFLLEIWAFNIVTREANLNRWLTVTCLSFFTGIFSFILFALSGGSLHGDGGPISFTFLLFGSIASAVFPISLIGFLVAAISRKSRGVVILDK
jgi:hypothetical protein